MRGRVVLAAVMTAAAAAPAIALDPQRASSQYVVTKWGARELGSNTVHALLQTPDGYVWLGTTAGLARFDGARFIVFNARTTPGFVDGGVTSLTLGADGTMHYGTTSGAVGRLRGGSSETLHANAGPGFISDVHASADGTLWWGQMGRPLQQHTNGVAVSHRELSGIGPVVMADDRRGGVWFGTFRDGIFHFDGKEYRRHPGVDDAVQALHVDRSGALWLGTPHGLLRRAPDGRVTRHTRADGLAHESVSALLEDHDANLWIGTAGGGLHRLTDGRITRFTRADGLSDDDVRALLEDHEGNLWVGTADGVSCLGDGRFVTHGRLEGLDDPAVSSVAPGANGDVWIGTMSGTVARLRGGEMTQHHLPGGVGRDAVIALAVDRRGDVWASLDNGRVFRLRAGVIADETPKQAPENWKASAIYEDEEGVAFFVHGPGLARLRDRRVVPLHPGGRTAGYVHEVFRARSGTTWLASSIGLVEVKGPKDYRVHDVGGVRNVRVRSIAEDADGVFWLATSAGLGRFRDGQSELLSLAQGLPETYLRLVLDDGHGALWIASMGHIFRLEKSEIAEVLAQRRATVSPVFFDTSDGLRATEASLSSDPGFKDAAGRLWFATSKGVASIDPGRAPANAPAPRVLVEGFTVDGTQGDPRSSAEAFFGPGRGEVTIEYTTLTYRALSHVRFRHRLFGLDDDWVNAGSRRGAYYSNLQPGRYRFVVAASNADGLWNGPETEIAFSIRPPFYRTGWFYAACLAAFLALVAAAYKIRLGQMHARFAAIVDERTRIARELHDTLAQMLAAVNFQIDTALKRLPNDPAQGPLRRNMELAHSMVRSGLAEVRRSIWVLRAQASGQTMDDLASTLSSSLSQLTGDTGIGSTFTVTGSPRSLPSDVQRNLLRIAHEAVTNAVRHAQPKSIGITLQFDDDAVYLRVHDDGRGFEREKVKGDHFGLMGITERARAVGGQATVDSRPGAGTEIACRVPYEASMQSPAALDVR
jgi:signal transduction histidine kinase/ligand-binding sensor domain-containing protein